ncbi:MAG: hypothetical protein QXH42_05990 [Thermoplasmata archaeon]
MMEIRSGEWSSTAGQVDLQIHLTVSGAYISELPEEANTTIPLPYAAVKVTVYDTSPPTIIEAALNIYHKYHNSFLTLMLQQFGNPPPQSITVDVTVEMNDGRAPNNPLRVGSVAYGVGGPAYYYGKSSQNSLTDNNDYTCNIVFADSGSENSSRVGAAAIYQTLVNTYIDVSWASSPFFNFYCWPPQEKHIEISCEYFQDDDSTSWRVGYDSVRFCYGLNILCSCAFEENYWPTWPYASGFEEYFLELWDKEFYDPEGWSEEECVYAAGFAWAWAAFSDSEGWLGAKRNNDLIYRDDAPDGLHIETWSINGKRFSGDRAGLRGERTVGCVAGLFWDMWDDFDVGDEDPDCDDEGFFDDEHLMLTWRIIDDGTYNRIKNIFRFYEAFQHIYWGPLVTDLAFSYMYNNIGMFTYGLFEGITDDGPHGLQVHNFEVLGMNTNARPLLGQYVLVRYELMNLGEEELYFCENSYLGVAVRDPQNNTCDCGRIYGPFRLAPQESIVLSNISTLSSVLLGEHKFWPCYWVGGRTGPEYWVVQNVTAHSKRILFEDFEGDFPEDNNWTVGSLIINRGFWDVENIDLNKVIWCNGSMCDPPEEYEDNMRAYMYTGIGDCRLANLHIHFDFCQTLEPPGTGDYDFFMIKLYSNYLGNDDGFIWEFREDTEGWEQVTIYLGPGLGSGDIKIEFYFQSDNVKIQKCGFGTFLDNIIIEAE